MHFLRKYFQHHFKVSILGSTVPTQPASMLASTAMSTNVMPADGYEYWTYVEMSTRGKDGNFPTVTEDMYESTWIHEAVAVSSAQSPEGCQKLLNYPGGHGEACPSQWKSHDEGAA